MCGIAGVFSYNSSVLPDMDRVAKMSAVLSHRGPDGEGLWYNEEGRIALAHRRLAIIDLSQEASQPMISSDGRFIIVFNGEIYNYKELKSRLIQDGQLFYTNSDTEVLLYLFVKFGKDCLSFLDGMFAFGIWDNKERKLFCARDRFGEKPFYYYNIDGQFIFSSEIKGIREYLGRLDIDLSVLQKYLQTKYKFGNIDSPFKDVKSLPSAHFLTIDADGLKIEKYWEIDLNKRIELDSDEAYFNKFRELFNESVQYRLRSDVPVGSSLSGGLDSSAVVVNVAGLEKKAMHTFSARFKGSKDEGKWIQEVVDKTGLKNHEIWPDEDGLLQHIDRITWHHEYPLGSGSVYAQWCVMTMPGSIGVRVLLDGQGADEFLCGYDELKYYAIWDLYHKGLFSDFFKERKLFNLNYGVHGKLGYAFMFDPVLRLLGITRKVYANGYTLKQQLKYYTTENLGELLRYADRNSMAHSIEVRLPFLSQKLVEFIFAIPDRLIYREGKTKFILRESMKSLLPEKIYQRTDKIGFSPPQQDWMESEVFKMKYNEYLDILKNSNLEVGPDKFRNIAVASFIKVFRA